MEPSWPRPRGDFEDAVKLAQEAIVWYQGSDYLGLHGDALMDLSDVLDMSGDQAQALQAAREALTQFQRKGHVPATQRALRRIAELERP